MNDYDIYLRHGAVRGGAWVGFLLARRGAGALAGMPARPHLHYRPWVLDPAYPNDPTRGSWGVWQWQFAIAMVEGVAGLQAVPPVDGRTPAQMRADLLAYLPLPAFELQDVDGAVFPVIMTGYREEAIEPYDAAHLEGGWLATIQLARTA